jgi:hypothetical protein
LAKHDPFRHIGQQLLKFAIAYKGSGRRLHKALYDYLKDDAERWTFVQEQTREAGYRNVDALLDEIIFERPAAAIIVIDELTGDLENVLGQLTMSTDVVELRTFASGEEVMHYVTPFQQDVRDAATVSEGTREVEELDTIVVPAQREGFERTFLGEDCWYAIRISSAMLDRIDYIAAYQTAPVSAITHVAKVSTIEKYRDTGKYILRFDGSAEEIEPIPLPEKSAGYVPQSPRYTQIDKLRDAETLRDVF